MSSPGRRLVIDTSMNESLNESSSHERRHRQHNDLTRPPSLDEGIASGPRQVCVSGVRSPSPNSTIGQNLETFETSIFTPVDRNERRVGTDGDTPTNTIFIDQNVLSDQIDDPLCNIAGPAAMSSPQRKGHILPKVTSPPRKEKISRLEMSSFGLEELFETSKDTDLDDSYLELFSVPKEEKKPPQSTKDKKALTFAKPVIPLTQLSPIPSKYQKTTYDSPDRSCIETYSQQPLNDNEKPDWSLWNFGMPYPPMKPTYVTDTTFFNESYDSVDSIDLKAAVYRKPDRTKMKGYDLTEGGNTNRPKTPDYVQQELPLTIPDIGAENEEMKGVPAEDNHVQQQRPLPLQEIMQEELATPNNVQQQRPLPLQEIMQEEQQPLIQDETLQQQQSDQLYGIDEQQRQPYVPYEQPYVSYEQPYVPYVPYEQPYGTYGQEPPNQPSLAYQPYVIYGVLPDQQYGAYGVLPDQQYGAYGVLPDQQYGAYGVLPDQQYGAYGVLPDQQYGAYGVLPDQQYGAYGVLPEQQYGAYGVLPDQQYGAYGLLPDQQYGAYGQQLTPQQYGAYGQHQYPGNGTLQQQQQNAVTPVSQYRNQGQRTNNHRSRTGGQRSEQGIQPLRQNRNQGRQYRNQDRQYRNQGQHTNNPRSRTGGQRSEQGIQPLRQNRNQGRQSRNQGRQYRNQGQHTNNPRSRIGGQREDRTAVQNLNFIDEVSPSPPDVIQQQQQNENYPNRHESIETPVLQFRDEDKHTNNPRSRIGGQREDRTAVQILNFDDDGVEIIQQQQLNENYPNKYESIETPVLQFRDEDEQTNNPRSRIGGQREDRTGVQILNFDDDDEVPGSPQLPTNTPRSLSRSGPCEIPFSRQNTPSSSPQRRLESLGESPRSRQNTPSSSPQRHMESPGERPRSRQNTPSTSPQRRLEIQNNTADNFDSDAYYDICPPGYEPDSDSDEAYTEDEEDEGDIDARCQTNNGPPQGAIQLPTSTLRSPPRSEQETCSMATNRIDLTQPHSPHNQRILTPSSPYRTSGPPPDQRMFTPSLICRRPNQSYHNSNILADRCFYQNPDNENCDKELKESKHFTAQKFLPKTVLTNRFYDTYKWRVLEAYTSIFTRFPGYTNASYLCNVSAYDAKQVISFGSQNLNNNNVMQFRNIPYQDMSLPRSPRLEHMQNSQAFHYGNQAHFQTVRPLYCRTNTPKPRNSVVPFYPQVNPNISIQELPRLHNMQSNQSFQDINQHQFLAPSQSVIIHCKQNRQQYPQTVLPTRRYIIRKKGHSVKNILNEAEESCEINKGVQQFFKTKEKEPDILDEKQETRRYSIPNSEKCQNISNDMIKDNIFAVIPNDMIQDGQRSNTSSNDLIQDNQTCQNFSNNMTQDVQRCQNFSNNMTQDNYGYPIIPNDMSQNGQKSQNISNIMTVDCQRYPHGYAIVPLPMLPVLNQLCSSAESPFGSNALKDYEIKMEVLPDVTNNGIQTQAFRPIPSPISNHSCGEPTINPKGGFQRLMMYNGVSNDHLGTDLPPPPSWQHQMSPPYSNYNYRQPYTSEKFDQGTTYNSYQDYDGYIEDSENFCQSNNKNRVQSEYSPCLNIGTQNILNNPRFLTQQAHFFSLQPFSTINNHASQQSNSLFNSSLPPSLWTLVLGPEDISLPVIIQSQNPLTSNATDSCGLDILSYAAELSHEQPIVGLSPIYSSIYSSTYDESENYNENNRENTPPSGYSSSSSYSSPGPGSPITPPGSPGSPYTGSPFLSPGSQGSPSAGSGSPFTPPGSPGSPYTGSPFLSPGSQGSPSAGSGSPFTPPGSPGSPYTGSPFLSPGSQGSPSAGSGSPFTPPGQRGSPSAGPGSPFIPPGQRGSPSAGSCSPFLSPGQPELPSGSPRSVAQQVLVSPAISNPGAVQYLPSGPQTLTSNALDTHGLEVISYIAQLSPGRPNIGSSPQNHPLPGTQQQPYPSTSPDLHRNDILFYAAKPEDFTQSKVECIPQDYSLAQQSYIQSGIHGPNTTGSMCTKNFKMKGKSSYQRYAPYDQQQFPSASYVSPQQQRRELQEQSESGSTSYSQPEIQGLNLPSSTAQQAQNVPCATGTSGITSFKNFKIKGKSSSQRYTPYQRLDITSTTQQAHNDQTGPMFRLPPRPQRTMQLQPYPSSNSDDDDDNFCKNNNKDNPQSGHSSQCSPSPGSTVNNPPPGTPELPALNISWQPPPRTYDPMFHGISMDIGDSDISACFTDPGPDSTTYFQNLQSQTQYSPLLANNFELFPEAQLSPGRVSQQLQSPSPSTSVRMNSPPLPQISPGYMFQQSQIPPSSPLQSSISPRPQRMVVSPLFATQQGQDIDSESLNATLASPRNCSTSPLYRSPDPQTSLVNKMKGTTTFSQYRYAPYQQRGNSNSGSPKSQIQSRGSLDSDLWRRRAQLAQVPPLSIKVINNPSSLQELARLNIRPNNTTQQTQQADDSYSHLYSPELVFRYPGSAETSSSSYGSPYSSQESPSSRSGSPGGVGISGLQYFQKKGPSLVTQQSQNPSSSPCARINSPQRIDISLNTPPLPQISPGYMSQQSQIPNGQDQQSQFPSTSYVAPNTRQISCPSPSGMSSSSNDDQYDADDNYCQNSNKDNPRSPTCRKLRYITQWRTDTRNGNAGNILSQPVHDLSLTYGSNDLANEQGMAIDLILQSLRDQRPNIQPCKVFQSTNTRNENNNADNNPDSNPDLQRVPSSMCIKQTFPKFTRSNGNFFFGFEHRIEKIPHENSAEGVATGVNLKREESNDRGPVESTSTHSDPLLYYPENYVNPIYYEERNNPPADTGDKKYKVVAHFSGRRTDQNDINDWANGLTKERRRVLICKLCKNYLTKARMLPCFHMFCSPCLEVFFKKREKQQICSCPVCDQTFPYPQNGVNAMRKAFWVHRLFLANLELLTYNQPPCTRGNDRDHSLADIYCENCKSFWCNKCFADHCEELHCRNELHRGIPILDFEKSRILKDVKNNYHRNICRRHNKPQLEFCNLCSVAMCVECARTHPNHIVEGCVLDLDLAVYFMKLRFDESQTEYLKSEREIKKRFNDLKEYDRRLKTDSKTLNQAIEQRRKQAHEFVGKLATRLIDKYNKALFREIIDLMFVYFTLKQLEIKCKKIGEIFPDCEICLVDTKIIEDYIWKCKQPKCISEIMPVEEKIMNGPGRHIPTASLGIFATKAKLCRKFKVMPLPIECIAIGKNGDIIVTIHRSLKAIGRTLIQITSTYIDDKDPLLNRINENCYRPFDACFAPIRWGDDLDNLVIVDRMQIIQCEQNKRSPWQETNVINGPHQGLSSLFTFGLKMNFISETPSGDHLAFNPLVFRPLRIRQGYISCNAPKPGWDTCTVTCLKYDLDSEFVIYNQPPDRTLLQWPEYMHINSKDTIIILDTVTYKLYFMDINGVVSHSYAKKSNAMEDRPTNFCIDSSDFVYICYRDGHRVDRLWPDGAFESTVVRKEDRLNSPTALAVHGNILLVGDVEGHLNYFRVEKKKLSPNQRQMYGDHQIPGVNIRAVPQDPDQ